MNQNPPLTPELARTPTETPRDTAFQFAAANLRFGTGITGEVGDDLVDLGARRVLVLIDPAFRSSETAATVFASLKRSRIDFEIYDQIVVEPTDSSFRAAASSARRGGFDSFLAVGGGARSTRPRRPICTRPTRPTFSIL